MRPFRDPAWLLPMLVSVAGLVFGARGARAFVQVRGGHFEEDGKPYAFVGTNLWYGMNLGMEGRLGDRARLGRELDRLAALGVRNLRVMAATQGPSGEPWRIQPALENTPGAYDERVLRGLDWLLAELGRRGMRAVVCLSNFWPWSGGMAQDLSWSGEGAIPYPPPAAGGSWDTYQAYTDRFYLSERPQALWRAGAAAIVRRKNVYTGRMYSDDRAIMSWELANEPRGGAHPAEFNLWLREASDYLKSLDRNHLVTTGSEGSTPWPDTSGLDPVLNHSYPGIDYLTAHLWVQNWAWFDPTHAGQSYPQAKARAFDYLDQQAHAAEQLSKPLVFEEFGIARDGGSSDPSARTTVRDRYFSDIFEHVYGLALKTQGTVAGVSFWAWAGEARPAAPAGGYWRPGLPFIGDPPHEAQGWYSVYDADRSTAEVIRAYARKMDGLRGVR